MSPTKCTSPISSSSSSSSPPPPPPSSSSSSSFSPRPSSSSSSPPPPSSSSSSPPPPPSSSSSSSSPTPPSSSSFSFSSSYSSRWSQNITLPQTIPILFLRSVDIISSFNLMYLSEYRSNMILFYALCIPWNSPIETNSTMFIFIIHCSYMFRPYIWPSSGSYNFHRRALRI